MEQFGIWYYFFITMALICLTIGISYIYLTNTSLLEKKGYAANYIRFIKKDTGRRLLGITIAVPFFMLLSAGLVWWIYGELDLTTGRQSFLFIVFFIVFVSPFPILDLRKTNKKYRELAMQSKSEIVVDLDYKNLHKIFNPMMELAAAILFTGYVTYLVRDFHISMVHTGILWLMYFSMRSAKNQVKPALKDGYSYGFLFLTLNHLLIIYHLLSLLFGQADTTLSLFIPGLVLALLLVLKLVLYFVNYSIIKQALS
ncbi:MAG: hypothetical protein OEX02_03690 [Cyclobacteriaceae bacterium]|nr:hypothetical protein [Cyclobacteriaceae bacterium]